MKPTTLYKVDLNTNLKMPCRICNTKSRPAIIDVPTNADLSVKITESLDLHITNETSKRFSKHICVECMALVNIVAEFRKICNETQIDLWSPNNEGTDRGPLVTELLLQVRQFELKGETSQKIDIVSTDELVDEEDEIIEEEEAEEVKAPEFKVDLEHVDGILDESEMVEEYLEENEMTPDRSPPMLLTKAQIFDCMWEGCHQKFRRRTALSKHVEEFHGVSLFECQLCDMKFLKSAKLIQHRAAMHPEKQLMQCHKCQRKYPWNRIKTHTAFCVKGDRRKGFRDQRQKLSKEEEKKKIMEDDRLFMCGICGNKFKTVHEYRTHFYLHSNPTQEFVKPL